MFEEFTDSELLDKGEDIIDEIKDWLAGSSATDCMRFWEMFKLLVKVEEDLSVDLWNHACEMYTTEGLDDDD